MQRKLSIMIVLTVMIIYAIMAYLTPTQFDDYEFISIYMGYNGGSESFSASAWWDFTRHMWHDDNARLGNALSPIMNLVVPWRYINWVITGVMMGLLLMLTMKAGAPGKSSARVAVLVWAMMIVLLPWRDLLFLLDYSLNYIYGAVFALAYLLLLVKAVGHRLAAGKTAGLLILAVVVGLWHEGFSTTILTGLAAVVIRHRFRATWQCYAAMILTALGTLYLLTCPGMIYRAAKDVGTSLETLNWRAWIDSVSMLLALASMALMCLTARGRAHMKRLLGDDMFLATLCCSLAGLLLSLYVRHTPRMSLWPGICGIILMLRIWLPVLRGSISHNAANVAAWMLLAGCLLQSGLAIAAQKKYFDEDRIIMQQFKDGAQTVYHDIIQPRDPSPLTLYFPARLAWVTGFNYHCLAHYLQQDYVAVVPTTVKHRPEHPDTISRAGSPLTVMLTERAVYTDWIPDLNCPGPVQVSVKRHGGDYETSDFNAINFTTADGDSLALLLPSRMLPADIDSLEVLNYVHRPEPEPLLNY